jgi:hypothetical protein
MEPVTVHRGIVEARDGDGGSNVLDRDPSRGIANSDFSSPGSASTPSRIICRARAGARNCRGSQRRSRAEWATSTSSDAPMAMFGVEIDSAVGLDAGRFVRVIPLPYVDDRVMLS